MYVTFCVSLTLNSPCFLTTLKAYVTTCSCYTITHPPYSPHPSDDLQHTILLVMLCPLASHTLWLLACTINRTVITEYGDSLIYSMVLAHMAKSLQPDSALDQSLFVWCFQLMHCVHQPDERSIMQWHHGTNSSILTQDTLDYHGSLVLRFTRKLAGIKVFLNKADVKVGDYGKCNTMAEFSATRNHQQLSLALHQ